MRLIGGEEPFLPPNWLNLEIFPHNRCKHSSDIIHILEGSGCSCLRCPSYEIAVKRNFVGVWCSFVHPDRYSHCKSMCYRSSLVDDELVVHVIISFLHKHYIGNLYIDCQMNFNTFGISLCHIVVQMTKFYCFDLHWSNDIKQKKICSNIFIKICRSKLLQVKTNFMWMKFQYYDWEM